MKILSTRSVLSCAVVVAVSVMPLCAQFTSFIDGTITDSSSAVIVNAEVSLLDTQTGILRKTQTSGSGYYRFPSLPASVFEITFKAPGFQTAVERAIKVDANETRSINLTLEVGRSETQVTVTGEAPQVQTSEARISGVISEKEVHDLPLVGRNYLTIANLTPGVTGLPSGGGQSYAQATGDIFTAEFSPGLSANGARGSGNNFMVDSASTNNVAHGGVTVFMPNAETIQEVSVMTNNFSAEHGRNSSILVNAITKQGTNAFHGTASWYHTNNHLSARTLFQDEVPVFQRNEYGATLGGPIWKNHTFFFSSFDRLDSGVGFARTAVIATPDFINYVRQARPNNISTNIWNSYPASVQPTNSFTTAGDLLGQNCGSLTSPSTPILTPVGSLPCNFNVYGDGNFSTTLPRNGLQWNARVDHTFNHDNDRLYGNIYRSSLDTILFNSPSVYPTFTEPSENYALYFNLNETHIFTPTILNEIGGSYVRVFGNNLCDPCSIPGISVQGIEGFGQGWGPGQFVQNIYEWRDVLSINKGSHSLRMGGKVQANQDYDDFGKIFLRPNYYFASVFDFANDQPFSQSNIGIDPVSGQKPPSSAGYTSSQDYNTGIFIQDDWKVRRNLTINMGLRWEIFPNLYQRHDQQTNILLPTSGDFTSRIADASVGYTSNHHLLNQSPKAWAPRIGLAWDPTGSGRMSVRAGAGVFYDRLAEGPISTSRQNPPLIAVLSASVLTPPTLPVFGLGTNTDPFNFPYPTGLQYGLNSHGGLLSGLANVNGADRDIGAARTYNGFVGLQYGLSQDLVVEADYVVSSGHGLYVMYDVNRFNGDLIQNGGVLTRLNPYFGAMNLAQSRINSFYNGAIFSVRKRFGHGFSVDGSYTFGKSLDGATVGGGGNEYDGTTIADNSNLARERGLSEFDVRQRFSFKGVWQLPGSGLSSGVLRSVIGGWQLSGVLILQSGIPFSVTCSTPFQPVFGSVGTVIGNTGCDYNADGFTYDYPNTPSWGNTKTGLSRSNYINGLFTPADFPAPPLGQEGDLGRNTFHGPGFANTDASLFKGFTLPWFLKESAQLQFRVDVFNLFNRVNLTQVNGDLASSVFGKSTSTYPARDIQLGLRLSF